MKILIACEESQAVTIAMRAKGHEAYSCDLLPCSGGHPEWHIQGDVLPLLGSGWDMIIAFPPCTHLAVSGARHFSTKQADGRQQQGIDFFLNFTQIKCRWAIENPIGIMSSFYRKPDQIIQPWQFGHNTQKATCLWLNGLPKLKPITNIRPEIEFRSWISKRGQLKRQSAWYYETRKKGAAARGMLASKTFPGIAAAMAEQWGNINN